MSDAKIVELARRGMLRRPYLIRIMRMRNAGILIGMVLATALLARFSQMQLGVILVLVGGVSSVFILLWNLIWVNTVLFQLTHNEANSQNPE